MAINIYQTQTMMAALQLLPPKPTFLRDRYFPTTPNDIFVTEDVLVEYKDEAQRILAPCVVPYKGGIAVARDGYKTERYTPANVAPERVLTIVNLQKKQFGETLFSQKTPAMREAALLAQDMIDLNDMIDAREEYMAAQTLLNNGYTMKHYADKYGGDSYEEFKMQFYDEQTNPAVYVPSKNWSISSTSMIQDMAAMARQLKRRGLAASDLVVASDVADVMINNVYIQKLLDNRRLNIVNINPTQLPNGATSIGVINVNGTMIELISYDAQYQDESKVTRDMIPSGKIVLTAPGCGRTLYGAVTQIEQSDGEFHTYASNRVPHVITDAKNSIKTLTQNAKPLTVPNFKNCAISATVLS
ncbi:MAG: major capsid protein [bacterium]|nr:major capsid protein [bacterium]